MVHKKGFGHMGLREGLKRASKRAYFGAYLGPILGQGLLRMGLVSSLIKGDLAIWASGRGSKGPILGPKIGPFWSPSWPGPVQELAGFIID